MVQIPSDDYDRMWEQLKNDQDLLHHVDTHVRFDYNTVTHEFVIRAASETHDNLIDSITDDIKEQLKLFDIDYVRSLKPRRLTMKDASIYFPDIALRHQDFRYPGVVMEIAHTQPESQVFRLADQYLIGADPNIHVVIGLSTGYWDSTKKARILEFRRADGSAVMGKSLRFQLKDLNIDEPSLKEQEINIPYEKLAEYLKRAERDQEFLRSDQPKVIDPPAIPRSLRPSTPPDKLATQDEKRFKQQESTVEERYDREDKDSRI